MHDNTITLVASATAAWIEVRESGPGIRQPVAHAA